MARVQIPILLLAVAMVGLLVLLVVFRPAAGTQIADPHEPPITMIVPEFSVVDRSGETITHEVLEGEYTVLDFFFTSCPLYCPGMTAAMKRVQTEAASNSVRLMSISIDGENDTPEIIGRYADGFGVDSAQWIFATGMPSVVWPIIDELGFEVALDLSSTAKNPSGDVMPQINHPTRLMLVGPDRRILGLYRYTDREDIDALIARLNTLLE